jgi:hypothetical protein
MEIAPIGGSWTERGGTGKAAGFLYWCPESCQSFGPRFVHKLGRVNHYKFEIGFVLLGICWGGRRGLNPRHSVPQTDALPAELLPPLTESLTWWWCGKKSG